MKVSDRIEHIERLRRRCNRAWKRLEEGLVIVAARLSAIHVLTLALGLWAITFLLELAPMPR